MDFKVLARTKETMVIVMGLRYLEKIVKRLIQEGITEDKAVAQ